MKISYICTNYNNSALTLAAVASLSKNTNFDINVFVVDNASRDDEVELLRAMDIDNPSVHLILNKQNVGYFKGLNIGIEAARRMHPATDWLVIGNNDLEFPSDFCQRIQKNQEEFREHSVISPDVVTLDGEHQNPHVISGISTTREIFYDLYYSNYYLGLLIHRLAKMFPRATRRSDEDEWKIARPIYQGHGSCYLLTPKFFKSFSSLWAPTFMMSEELFLSLQLKKQGEQVYYSPAIRVIHQWHGSLKNIPNRHRWNMSRDAHREYRKHVNIFKGPRD